MRFSEQTIDSYLELLSSKAAVPGGGAASALTGAVSASLSHMVASLTVGKAKYADAENDMLDVLARAEVLRVRFTDLMDEDAQAFSPLSRAYRLPKDTPEQKQERQRVMESALREAAQPPLKMMEACKEALLLAVECAEKGNSLAVSDAGVAASLCRAALESACLNVLINTQPMLDREYAERLNFRARRLLAEYGGQADALYTKVSAKLEA
jgi:formiminotetrahydrofolate cyclodeaminase